MAVGAKDSEMIKLKYFLKDLGCIRSLREYTVRNTGSGLLRVQALRKSHSALGRSGTASRKERKQSVSFRKPLGEAWGENCGRSVLGTDPWRSWVYQSSLDSVVHRIPSVASHVRCDLCP